MARRVRARMLAYRALMGPAGVCVIGALALVSSASGAPVLKCVDPAGKVTYQSKPCDVATAQSSIKIEPPPPLPERRIQAPASPGPTIRRTPTREELAQINADEKGLRETWQRLGQAIDRGDTNAALREMTPGAQERYRRVFDTVTKKSDPPFKFEQLGKIERMTVMERIATITIVRKKADGNHAYEIMLMKGPDGKWLIDGM